MLSRMQMSTSSRCIKYLMFIFNLLFVITGIILLISGSVILGAYSYYFHFLDDKFLSVPNLLIAVGAIIVIVAFFGCCGAVRENYCMIITFITLLVLIFIMELAGGISGYVLRDQAAEVIRGKMSKSMESYNTSYYSSIWDDLQRNLKCCGTVNSTDWTRITNSQDLPLSCCHDVYGAIGKTNCTTTSHSLYTNGCLDKVQEIIKAHAIQLGGVGIGIAFVQAVGIWFAVYLARAIKRSYENV